jgi:hypothetical protein
MHTSAASLVVPQYTLLFSIIIPTISNSNAFFP